ncbi:hypothetical protein MNBD_NITROSPINAE02-1710 [hydrothermal vent metagenome]|uniref:YkgJ family cysteine cluster protein n=1 Tax=hydrothermal vent metagenome TaxID=652676 RepID=A0A3B1C4E9_9ZZZZ
MKRAGECERCGECCKTLRIRGTLSEIIAQHGSLDEARAYYSFRGINLADVNEKNDAILFELDIPCDKLTGDNLCALHDTPKKKPVICHRYPWFPDDVKECGFNWK